MKFAFSTLGVPGMPVPDVVALAVETGYQGVELRAHPEEPVHPGISMPERAAVVAEFERAGVDLLTVCGYTGVAAAGDDAPVYKELDELMWLAKDLGAPYVRVFAGAGDQDTDEAEATAARRLGTAAETAAELGVRILLETHDSHRTGAGVSRILGTVGHKHVGAIWDVVHPWLDGETPAAAHAALAPFLGYVQVKDVASADDLAPLPLGAGVLPLAECLATLTEETWLCWEYEKRWHPEAADLPGLLVPGREHLERLLATVR
ncbi:sugar phosphate isomerase/epimerase [Streptomyces sp. SLBN-118]|uniref:sugar phosphate isomerase/epimerase family protein n=1 Tax=Streptomyces sp. SLBN-118 TaxID=2768454 RepID=UPI00116AAAD5|nr:sugar phosphate isomerase/epimerase family protein [Streptomyces sp. SLBN-118]TQK44701.1 sugar phosphate isomerase/epimerase [Streptomyces sp. SLBN-118]